MGIFDQKIIEVANMLRRCYVVIEVANIVTILLKLKNQLKISLIIIYNYFYILITDNFLTEPFEATVV